MLGRKKYGGQDTTSPAHRDAGAGARQPDR